MFGVLATTLMFPVVFFISNQHEQLLTTKLSHLKPRPLNGIMDAHHESIILSSIKSRPEMKESEQKTAGMR